MKRITFFIVYFFIAEFAFAQIAHYNQFPTMQPQHILDDNLENISFSFSMRVLNSDYDGALVRLRKDDDNTEEDFGWSDNDIVDISAIDTWRSGANVYVVAWYDQSGLGRNATQADQTRQPQFYTNSSMPFFRGDGSNDYLTVDTPNGIQDLTNEGAEGTVLGVMRATKKSQHTFGVLNGNNRWSTHINWSNNNVYFDPGFCCNTIRNFDNSTNVGVWEHYSFYKTSGRVIARVGGLQKFNGLHTKASCTLKEDFAIGWAEGETNSTKYATTSFLELIMYNTNKSIGEITEIEDNTITFWNL